MAGEPNGQGEFVAHERDYSRFTGMVKWGTIAAAIVTLIVVLMIAS